MTTTKQITGSQNNIRLVVLFVLLLLSGVGMFGQEAAPVQSSVAVENTVGADGSAATVSAAAEANANINIVSWFMGSKQSPKANGAMNTKKQMINSGIAPNRLLIKTFLKKASSFQTAVA